MAGDIIEGINPTRMELIAVRKKRLLAEKGHKLLGDKRDALVVQFLDVLKKRKRMKGKVLSSLKEARYSIENAQAIMGYESVRSYSRGAAPYPDPQINSINIMGVKVPVISDGDTADMPLPWGMGSTPSALDDSALGYRKALEDLLNLAEAEGAMELLALEIQKTKRRVNALEHIFIPRLVNTERYINMQLQEREREDFFRRKRIKALMENAKKS